MQFLWAPALWLLAIVPMAGAPRTARSWMAAATSSLVVQARYSTTKGSLR